MIPYLHKYHYSALLQPVKHAGNILRPDVDQQQHGEADPDGLEEESADFVEHAGAVHLEEVEEDAEGARDEVDHNAEGVGAAQYEIEWKCEEQRVEEDIEFAHLLHEAFGAGVVLLEGVCLDGSAFERQADVLARFRIFVFGANAFSGFLLIGRGEINLLLDEPDGEEDADYQHYQKLHEDDDALSVLKHSQSHSVTAI